MRNPSRSRAEAKFAAARRSQKQALDEAQQARKQRAELTAKLRALRLSKEAAENEIAESAAATTERPIPVPRARRRRS